MESIVDLEVWGSFVDWLLGQEALHFLGCLTLVCRSFGELIAKRTPLAALRPILRGQWKPAVNCARFPNYEAGTASRYAQDFDWSIAHRNSRVAVGEFHWTSEAVDLWLLERPGHWYLGGPISLRWHSSIPLQLPAAGRNESLLWIQLLPDGNICLIAAKGTIGKQSVTVQSFGVVLVDSNGEVLARDVVVPARHLGLDKSNMKPQIRNGELEVSAGVDFVSIGRLASGPLKHLSVPPPTWSFYRYPIAHTTGALRLPLGSEWTFDGRLGFRHHWKGRRFRLTEAWNGGGAVLAPGPHPMLPSLLLFQSLQVLDPVSKPADVFYLHACPALPEFTPNMLVRLVRPYSARFPTELSIEAADLGAVCDAHVRPRRQVWSLVRCRARVGWVPSECLTWPDIQPAGRVEQSYQPVGQDELLLLQGGQVKVLAFADRHGRWLVRWRDDEGKVPAHVISIKPQPIFIPE